MVKKDNALSMTPRKPKMTEDVLAIVFAFGVAATIAGYVQFDIHSVLGSINNKIIIGVLLILSAAAIFAMLIGRWFGINLLKFEEFPWRVLSFPFIILLIWFSKLISSRYILKSHDLSIIIWAFIIGFIIRNIFLLPQWIKPAIRTSLYTKTGLVLMGSGVALNHVWKIGMLSAILIGLGSYVLWHICWTLKNKLKITDDDVAILIFGSTSFGNMPGCNVVGKAIKADSVVIDQITSLFYILTIPMVMILPSLVQWLGIPDLLAGIWLGSAVETTSAVAISSLFMSGNALNALIAVKIVQGIYLTITVYILSILWALRKKNHTRSDDAPRLRDILTRYPKYLIGIVLMAMIFLSTKDMNITKIISDRLFNNISWWFALIFLCMGVDTDVRSLIALGFRPVVLLTTVQIVNFGWLMLLIYVIFPGY